MAHVFFEFEGFKILQAVQLKCTLEVNYSIMRKPSIIMARECVYAYSMTYS